MKNPGTLIVKSVTVLIYSTLAFLVLSALLAMLLPLLVDFGNYKAQITDMVLAKTGRTLTVIGTVQVDLFPNPTITLEQVALSNAPGFSAAPMMQIRHVHGKVPLWQLLKNQFTFEQLAATGVQITLERDATGANNWDDLAARMAADVGMDPLAREVAPLNHRVRPSISLAQLGAISLASLAVRGITLKESEVRLCEREGATQAVVCLTATNLGVNPGLAKPGQTIQVTAQTNLTTHTPPFVGQVTLSSHLPQQAAMRGGVWNNTRITVRGRLDLPPVKELELVWQSDMTVGPEPQLVHVTQADSRLTVWSDSAWFREFALSQQGTLQADLNTGKIYLPDGGMAWQVKADYLPPAGVRLEFQSPVEIDWFQESLQIAALRATGPAQIRLAGRLRGQHLFSEPRVEAELTALPFDPRALLIAMGRQVPFTADPKVFASAEFAATIHGDRHGTAVTNMTLGLDQSKFFGEWQVGYDTDAGITAPQIRFDLRGDMLELDRYLPPELTFQQNGGRTVLAIAAPEVLLAQIPVALLQALDLQGILRLDRLRLAPSQATDLTLNIGIKDGQLRLQPYRLNLYGGSVETQAQVDILGNESVLVVDKTIKGLRLEPLLQEVSTVARSGKAGWSGVVDVTAHLSGRGERVDVLRKNLNGTLNVLVREGSVPGMNLVGRIRENYFASRERRPPASGTDKKGGTAFSRLTATATITRGVLENTDFLAVAPAMRVTGRGKMDLARATVDYLLEADVVSSLWGVAGPNLDEFKGLVLPIRMQGDWATLKVPSGNMLDFTRLSRATVATSRVPEAAEESDQGEGGDAKEKLKRLLGIGR